MGRSGAGIGRGRNAGGRCVGHPGLGNCSRTRLIHAPPRHHTKDHLFLRYRSSPSSLLLRSTSPLPTGHADPCWLSTASPRLPFPFHHRHAPLPPRFPRFPRFPGDLVAVATRAHTMLMACGVGGNETAQVHEQGVLIMLRRWRMRWLLHHLLLLLRRRRMRRSRRWRPGPRMRCSIAQRTE